MFLSMENGDGTKLVEVYFEREQTHSRVTGEFHSAAPVSHPRR